MTVIMRKNIGEKKIMEVAACSSHGDGVLYITDRAVAYEVHGRGIYLNFIPHGMIADFGAAGPRLFGATRFGLAWVEDGTRHRFEFRTRDKGLESFLRDKLKDWRDSGKQH